MTSASEDAFRSAMAGLPAPVAVVTTVDAAGRPRGFTASAVCSLSLQPPLLLVCVGHSNRSHRTFLTAPHFLVSVLADRHADLARRFATARPDKFDTDAVARAELGLPGVTDAPVRIACRRHDAIDAGDHTILVGRVVELARRDEPPLVYHGRGFHGLRSLDPVPAS